MKTDIDNALGISISEEKIVQAVEDVYTHTDNMQKDYTLRQEKTINTDKYEETITIVLCGTMGNDGRNCIRRSIVNLSIRKRGRRCFVMSVEQN